MINFPVIIDIAAEHHDDYHTLLLYKLGWILLETRFAKSLNAEKGSFFKRDERDFSSTKVLSIATNKIWFMDAFEVRKFMDAWEKEDVSRAFVRKHLDRKLSAYLMRFFNFKLYLMVASFDPPFSAALHFRLSSRESVFRDFVWGESAFEIVKSMQIMSKMFKQFYGKCANSDFRARQT